MLHEILHIAAHTLIDTIKTLPILYLVYLLIMFLQRRMELEVFIGKQERRFGPLMGAALGSIPQCGFSAACAELYSASVIGVGTLIPVFLATSDEAVPVLLSHPGQLPTVLLLLAVKILIAVLAGYFFANTIFKKETERLIQQTAYNEEDYAADEYEKYLAEQSAESVEEAAIDSSASACSCGDCSGNIFFSALYHTARTGIVIAITLAVIELLLHLLGEDNLALLMLNGSIFQPCITALLGLIPGCAVSVTLIELYLSGAITFGSAVAGLSTGAGFGYLILFGRVHDKKRCFLIVGCVYLAAVISGLILHLLLG